MPPMRREMPSGEAPMPMGGETSRDRITKMLAGRMRGGMKGGKKKDSDGDGDC